MKMADLIRTPKISRAWSAVGLRRREAELVAANKVSQTLLNSMKQMIYVAEIETDALIFVNDVMLDAFDVQQDYQGKKYWTVFEQSAVELVNEAKNKLQSNPDQPVIWEVYQPYLKKEISCVARYIEWIDGRTVFLRSCFDISDIKQAERTLNEQLVQQHLMSDITRDFMQLGDADGPIERCLQKLGGFLNCYRVALIGYDRKNKQVRNTYEWYNPALADAPYEKFEATLDENQPGFQKMLAEKTPFLVVDNPGVYAHMRDDRLQSFLAAPYFINDAFGGILQFMTADPAHVWSDSEIQLAVLVASTLSVYFTRQEATDKLMHATRAAEAANNAKSTFLSNMSHEMRTPLNAIIGMTEIALGKAAPPDVRHCLQNVQAASNALLGLVNNVLDMSKIEAARLQLVEEDFRLDEMLAALHRIVSIRADEKNQRVVFYTAETVPAAFHGDSLRLSQILTNLLYNAIKFSDDGADICLTIALDALEGEIASLRFDCIDHGVGMEPGLLERVFLPFEQGDPRSVRRFGGTGLGLTLSKEIAQLMHGDITVQSEPGTGSVFTLTVALACAACPDADADDPPETADLRGRHILYMEDVLINREIVKEMLNDTHVEIDEAENGRIGLELFRAHPDKYDLVLMDIQMPELDGYGAAREIRALGSAVPVIALSANAFADDVEKSMQCGMNDHIIKPVDRQVLLGTLMRYLRV